MKNKISAIAAVCVVIVLFAACSKPASPLALYVPADASAVFIIDPKSITDKMTSSGISIDSLTHIFSTPLEESPMIWNKIQDAGVRLDKPIYAFYKELNSMQEGYIRSSAVLAEVQDEKKIATFFQDTKAGKSILSGGDYKYIALGDDYVAGWTKDILIIAQVSGGNDAPGNYGTGQGTLSQQLLTTMFTQKKSASIAEAEGFEAMLAKPGDIHFYTANNSNLAAEKIPAGAALQSLIKDSYTEGVINFENGKITASLLTHYGKALAEMMAKYPPKQISKDMISNYPDTLTGFVLASFDPHIINDVLHYTGFDNMADGFASDLGFTSKDVMNAFSGDIAVLFSKNPSVYGPMAVFAKPSYLLNFRIADKALFDKIANGLVRKQMLTKNGDEYRIGLSGGHDFVIETGNNSLFIASSDELIKAYQSGSSKATIPAAIDKQVNDKSMALYVDINSLLAGPDNGNSHQDSANGQDISALTLATFKDFIATVDKSDGKTANTDIALNFVNTNENSLASIVKLISAMKADQLRREMYHPGILPDSTDGENENN